MSPNDLTFRVRHWMLDTPTVGDLYLGRRARYRELLPGPCTELVMDGFPRSANSYAMFAFHVAQGTTRTLAGHTHSARIYRIAERLGLPSVVIVREPQGVVNSVMHFYPKVAPRSVLLAYRRFHGSVASMNVLPVRFESVVSDFGQVIASINNVFGTSFVPYMKSQQNEAVVRTRIEEASTFYAPERPIEAVVSRPSQSRRVLFDTQRLESVDRSLLTRCRLTYDDLIAKAD